MSNSIELRNNGPIKLEYEALEVSANGETITLNNPAFLCRCGLSENKPYCDGAHRKAGFSDAREISDEIIQEYPGTPVSIRFNRSICSGAARCVKKFPGIFSSESSENWIFPDKGTTEEIQEAIQACPSGALSMSIEGQAQTPEGSSSPSIDIIKDGPYLVEGIELENFSTTEFADSTKYALCRCGLSKNKPFCDYTHAEEKWSDS